MSSTKPLRNITVFGAGGSNIGHHLVKALLAKPDQFTVSIIARKSSSSTFPEGAEVKYVDDELPHDQLVAALQGQDALVSAIGFRAIALEQKLIDAAIDAGVRRFLPSEYGVNNANPPARELCPVFDAKGAIIDTLRQKEASGLTWTAVPTGLWLDWALEPAISFAAINVEKHTAGLWGKGTHTLSWSTLPWAAEGIAQILLAPELTANKVVPIRAFEASQSQIIAVLERIQNTKYSIDHFDADTIIPKAKDLWKSAKDGASALQLVKAGFFLDGYGSDLVGEGIVPVGNEFLDLQPLKLEDVIAEAVRKWK